MTLDRTAMLSAARAYKRVALLAVCVCVAGCSGGTGSPVPVPSSDSTPPVVTAVGTLGKSGGEVEVTPTSGPISASWKGASSLVLGARAEDPEGVREVAIWGTTEKTCTDASGIATKTGPGLPGAPLAASTDTATPGGTTYSARQVQYTIEVSSFVCPPGTQELIAKQVFWATATNFGAGATKSDTLTLTYTRPYRPVSGLGLPASLEGGRAMVRRPGQARGGAHQEIPLSSLGHRQLVAGWTSKR